jgi:WD40 repeat protein
MYGHLSEDRQRLWHLDNRTDSKFGWPPRWEITESSFQSLNPLRHQEIMPEDHPNGAPGLVPGGRYFHLGTQIYERKTFALVSEQRFLGLQVAAIAFTPDGRRYAAVVDGLVYVDGPWDPHRQSLACICDTVTGEILQAWPVSKRSGARRQSHVDESGRPSDSYHFLRFSPDGRRLAIVNVDGMIEIWDLPEVKTR